MFDNLSDSLQGAFKSLKGQAILSEKNISDAMEKVRYALLEADVSYDIVEEFIADVTKEAVGEKVKNLKESIQKVAAKLEAATKSDAERTAQLDGVIGQISAAVDELKPGGSIHDLLETAIVENENKSKTA